MSRVDRTCTEVLPAGSDRRSSPESHPTVQRRHPRYSQDRPSPEDGRTVPVCPAGTGRCRRTRRSGDAERPAVTPSAGVPLHYVHGARPEPGTAVDQRESCCRRRSPRAVHDGQDARRASTMTRSATNLRSGIMSPWQVRSYCRFCAHSRFATPRHATPQAMAMLDELLIAGFRRGPRRVPRVGRREVGVYEHECRTAYPLAGCPGGRRFRYLCRSFGQVRGTAGTPRFAARSIPDADRSPTRRPSHADAVGVYRVARRYRGPVGPDGFQRPLRQIRTGRGRLLTAGWFGRLPTGPIKIRPPSSAGCARSRT